MASADPRVLLRTRIRYRRLIYGSSSRRRPFPIPNVAAPNNALWSAAAAPLECGGIEQTFRLSDNLRSPDGALAATSTLRRRGWRILARPDHVPDPFGFS